jgi:hypothetical protein
MNNDASAAFRYLNKIDITAITEDHNRICLIATTGLAYYRSGFPDIGRNFYLQAFEQARQKKFTYYYSSALLNLTREEIIVDSPEAKNLYEQAMKIDDNGNLEIRCLKNQVEKLMLRHTTHS